MAEIKPIKKTKISDEVLSQLKQNIISGVYAPNERLPSEGALCTMFQVSRISIRTALHKLAAIGLIETRNGEGTFVCSADSSNMLLPLLQNLTISPMGILELLEFREAVDRLSCRLAAERGTPEDVQKLEQI
jgi:GntR family transcriptional repressor for pyruvate dehydrogenase complex